MKSEIYAQYNGENYSADYINEDEVVLRMYTDDYSNRGFEKYCGYNKNIKGYIKNGYLKMRQR